MVHRKSQRHYEQHLSAWEKQQLKKDILRYIVREYSVRCFENGDKVWHPQTEPAVRDMLEKNSEDGCVVACFVRHDYGEVLNRFEEVIVSHA
jgi:hypothetical protein